MEFWTSGEVYGELGRSLITYQKKIEEKINKYIASKNYGSGLTLWYYLSILIPKDKQIPNYFEEIKKYRKSKKEIEFRLRINFEDFEKSNDPARYKLICESILRSIDIAKKEYKIKDFDLDTFEKDIKDCCKKEGWTND